MADNYWGCCALCEYFNLFDKDGGRYRCIKTGHYFTVFEKQCHSYFKPAGPIGDKSRSEAVDLARENKL